MTAAQTTLNSLLEEIEAAQPGPVVHLPEGANMFNPGKIQVNTEDENPIFREMNAEELAQEAAENQWCARNRLHYNLTKGIDAAAKAAFDSLPEGAKIAFLQSGPHRWSGGDDASRARFKVLVSRGSYAVMKLGAEDDITDARILISAAARGAETEQMIARLATFQA
jgi:hypothetical protein